MQIPNLTLAFLIAELTPLIEGSIVRKVQELENNWLKLKMQTRQGTKDLIISPNAFYVTSFSLPAKQQSSGFGAFLRKRIANKRVLSLKQHEFDRIALLEFDNSFLVLELFAKGNTILVDKEMKIVSAYRREQWKDRKISKEQEYKFPSSKGKSPVSLTLKEFSSLLSSSSSDCIRTIVSGLNIAPILGEGACALAKIDKSSDANKLSAPKAKALLKALKGLYKVDLKKLKPGLSNSQLLPFALSVAKFDQEFPSLNNAIDQHFSMDLGSERLSSNKSKKAKAERNLETQLASVKELELKIEQSKKAGETIYSNYQAISQALSLAKGFAAGEITKKDIMYKLSLLGLSLKQIDLKNRKLVVELTQPIVQKK